MTVTIKIGGEVLPALSRGGPRPIEISPVAVGVLAALMMTVRDMADYFGVSESTMKRRLRVMEYTLARRRGMGKARVLIAKKQFDALKAGNVVMAIWLGKQYLGQSDSPVVDRDLDDVYELDHAITPWTPEMEAAFQKTRSSTLNLEAMDISDDLVVPMEPIDVPVEDEPSQD